MKDDIKTLSIALVVLFVILAILASIGYIISTENPRPTIVICAVPLLGPESLVTLEVQNPRFTEHGTVVGEGGVYRLGHGEVCTEALEEKK